MFTHRSVPSYMTSKIRNEIMEPYNINNSYLTNNINTILYLLSVYDNLSEDKTKYITQIFQILIDNPNMLTYSSSFQKVIQNKITLLREDFREDNFYNLDTNKEHNESVLDEETMNDLICTKLENMLLDNYKAFEKKLELSHVMNCVMRIITDASNSIGYQPDKKM